MAKGDIAWLIMTSGTAHSCLVDIFIILARWQHALRIWSWVHLGPHFGGRGGRTGSTMVLFGRAIEVSYRLSIVTVALSVTIRPQFAIECLRRSNQQGVGHSGAKFEDEEIDRCKPF